MVVQWAFLFSFLDCNVRKRIVVIDEKQTIVDLPNGFTQLVENNFSLAVVDRGHYLYGGWIFGDMQKIITTNMIAWYKKSAVGLWFFLLGSFGCDGNCSVNLTFYYPLQSYNNYQTKSVSKYIFQHRMLKQLSASEFTDHKDDRVHFPSSFQSCISCSSEIFGQNLFPNLVPCSHNEWVRTWKHIEQSNDDTAWHCRA